MGLPFNKITAAILGKIVAATTFPTLVNPYTLSVGDSMAQKENFALATGTATLTRDGTTNLGRITAPITNSGANSQWGTPRVAIVNMTDTSFEVLGRNNFQDSTTTAVSIHTKVADTFASRLPAANSTTAATTTQAIANGFIINQERFSHIGVLTHTNALMGGGIDIGANLGHPGVMATGAGATSEVAYAKALCLAAGGTPLIFYRLGINDVKGNVTPNNIFAAIKTQLDSLTGMDGGGGNAVVVVRSVSSLGSTVAAIGGLTYAQVNETVIGKCATSAAPTTLAPDAVSYTIQTVLQHTLNYQIWAYCQANLSKLLFVDCTSQNYNFTAQCTYDTANPDAGGNGSTGDGTHYRTVACMRQASNEVSMISPYVSYSLVVPRSAADATTPGGRTRMANRGPWTTATVTTGFLTGGSASTLLPKGGVAGQPSGWVCGRSTGTGTVAVSVYDPGDALGDWVNLEVAAVTAGDTVQCYPWTSSGVSLATLGIGSSIDGSEYQFVFETRWDNATASGLAAVRATMQTNGSGVYGYTTNGENGDDGLGMLDTSPAGNRKIATGWIQMSDPFTGGTQKLLSLTPIINVVMGSITGVTANVGIRCVGINKR